MKKITLNLIISIFTFSLAVAANDQGYDYGYPRALPNSFLQEEHFNQTDRKIPKVDWFTAAVDGHAYMRLVGREDFYHGFGYWVQGRTEFRPREKVHINIRSIFYSGSISGGYTEPTGQYHLFGFYVLWPDLIAGGTLEGRVIDIERQTVGQGLMIQDKEMAGAWFKWKRDTHAVTLRGDGTGSLIKQDDMMNIQIDLYEQSFSLGTVYWIGGESQTGLGENRKPHTYLSSAHNLIGKSLSYYLEVGVRDLPYGQSGKSYAGLLGLKSEVQLEQLKLNSRIQGRYYDRNYSQFFANEISQTYVSYDQYDKRFDNPSNILLQPGRVSTYSAVLDADYEFSHHWSVHMRNEAVYMDYETDDSKYYFYRYGFSYRPYPDTAETITFFASNKVINANLDARPPWYDARNMARLFNEVDFIGAEASFRF